MSDGLRFILDDNKRGRRRTKDGLDPIRNYLDFSEFLEEFQEKIKRKKEKSEAKSGNLVQQVILLMAIGPLVGTTILWCMSYMLTDAINHLARIHN